MYVCCCRTLESKRRRAQTRALHSALSGPLQQAASAGVESSDNEEAEEDNIEDDLDGQDPEVSVSGLLPDAWAVRTGILRRCRHPPAAWVRCSGVHAWAADNGCRLHGGLAQVVAEARVRLVAGLKRYFHEKRAQGLLTGRGILVLDHACDAAMDDSEQPLLIWAIVERCALLALHSACLPRLFLRRVLSLQAPMDILESGLPAQSDAMRGAPSRMPMRLCTAVSKD